jgi:DNA-directed RNA polymerase specialized sigma54-like protein
MTFFFWACQFTIDPYVKMFHINKHHLTKKITLLGKNVINITKFVKHNTTGNQLLHVKEKRQERERSNKDHKRYQHSGELQQSRCGHSHGVLLEKSHQ